MALENGVGKWRWKMTSKSGNGIAKQCQKAGSENSARKLCQKRVLENSIGKWHWKTAFDRKLHQKIALENSVGKLC
jgi:hypothetical protein